MSRKSLNTTHLLNHALLAELSYLSFSSLNAEETATLKSKDFDAKRPILIKLIEEQFPAPRNTQLLNMIQTFDFLDIYSEKLYHNRQMIAVREINGKQAIFAVRGTLVTSIRDIFTDINFGLRKLQSHPRVKKTLQSALVLSPLVPGASVALGVPALVAVAFTAMSKFFTVEDYLDEAKIFIIKNKINHKIKHDDITVVGHSLGAIFAQMISAHSHIKGVGFNGFTLDESLFDEHQLKNVHNNFFNFTFDKDILSNLGDYWFGKNYGHNYKIQSFEKENVFSAHSMSNCTTNIVRFSELKKITNSNLDVDQLSSIIEIFGRKDFILAALIKILHRPKLSFDSIRKTPLFRSHSNTTELQLLTLFDKIVSIPDGEGYIEEFDSLLKQTPKPNENLSKGVVK